MPPKALPPPELLRQLLRYEPTTGSLYWRSRPAEMFSSEAAARQWNARHSGALAFTCTNSGGYRIGSILGEIYKAHRIIWAITTGKWPDHFIDHINHDRSDNRISNLREATRAQNNQNIISRPGSASSYLGVIRDQSGTKWIARICGGEKQRQLGVFECEIEAARAYDQAALLHYGEFASLNFPLS